MSSSLNVATQDAALTGYAAPASGRVSMTEP